MQMKSVLTELSSLELSFFSATSVEYGAFLHYRV